MCVVDAAQFFEAVQPSQVVACAMEVLRLTRLADRPDTVTVKRSRARRAHFGGTSKSGRSDVDTFELSEMVPMLSAA
eukprot:10520566-Alexandrium_andersonii.AAC.1